MIKTYNRLYKDGKPVGKVFRDSSARKGETREELRRRALKQNAHWNKFNKKAGYSVKLVKVAERSYKRKTSRSNNPFGLPRWRF